MFMRPLIFAAALSYIPLHAQLPAAITADPPLDKTNPAGSVAFSLPSHGEKLNALALTAAGAGPHPIVILLHGFPGNERNFDLAQAIRRTGRDVLFFNYRGSWGSPGDFSFTHAIEDAQAAVEYLQDPANAAKLRSDPKNIIVIGHSMGGMITVNIGANNPSVRAIGLISGADMGSRALDAVKAGGAESASASLTKSFATQSIVPLAGCTPESLATDLLANDSAWDFPTLATKLATRPVLDITSNDGLAPANDVFVSRLRALKNPHVTTLHLPTDHTYDDQRIALEISVLKWLDTL